jgi:hypothetical protein
VKSGGDFEDILAEDTPAIWQTNRPAKGGETGAMLATIIERAAKIKAGRDKSPTSHPGHEDTKTRRKTSPRKPAARKTKKVSRRSKT